MSAQSETLELDELTIRFTDDGDRPQIVWQGTSELQDPAASIGGFLRGLIPHIRGKSVTMDFRSLGYMNSATLQPLLLTLKEYNAANILTEIIYDATVEWQRIVFRSVAAISTTLSKVTIRRG